MKLRLLLSALLLIGLFAGCKKDEGEGGRGVITGRVYQKDMRPDNTVRAEYYAPEVRVYIIYGSDEGVYDDDMRTDFDGRYKFEWLRPGTYTVYTYSECRSFADPDCPPSQVYAIKKTITIGKREVVELEDIVILNY